MVPTAAERGLLVNPTDPACRDHMRDEAQAAASTLGLKLHVIHASTERDFDMAFATVLQLHAGALVIGTDPFFITRSEQLAASRDPPRGTNDLPVSRVRRGGWPYELWRQFYGAYRQAGIYTGRILKGEKPADLPVSSPLRSS